MMGRGALVALLALCAVPFAVPAGAASFDCARAKSSDERAVCASRTSSEMDIEISVRFEMLAGLVPMGTRGAMQDEQRVFLAARKACGADRSCLAAAYGARIAVLKSEYARLRARGPF